MQLDRILFFLDNVGDTPKIETIFSVDKARHLEHFRVILKHKAAGILNTIQIRLFLGDVSNNCWVVHFVDTICLKISILGIFGVFFLFGVWRV